MNIREHKVKVIAKGPYINLLLKGFFYYHINISNIKHIDENTLSFITKKDNLKIIRKEFKDYNFFIKKDLGIYSLKPFVLRNKIFFTSFLVGVLLFLFLTNVIVKVDVIHSDKEIRELVTDELEIRGVKRLTLKKNFKKLQTIKEDILEKYPDKLEWIEIENVGMTYKVRIEQRVINKKETSNNYCHIVATKDAMLTKINSINGLNIKNSGDYVEKGDIVISGDILLNNEVKKSLCAQGEVYGEVWYNVDVKLPMKYKQKTKTGKTKINFMYENSSGKHEILKSRFKEKQVENKKLFSLWGVSFYYQKEYEVEIENKKYNEEEALKRAMELAKEKVSVKLSDKERIITQKVLKTSIKDSTMYIVVFTSVEENIGKQEEYVPNEEKPESREDT